MSQDHSPYVLSVDIGTSSVRAALYDSRGEVLPRAASQRPQKAHTTPDGGAEMRADDVVNRVVLCAADALAHAGRAAGQVAGVAVSTYWHSVLGVGANGRALTPLFLWSDTRSVAQVAELRQRLDADALHRRTGCPLHTSYVAPKILWFAQGEPRRFQECRRWMSIGEYLFLRLFGEPRCSFSMASGTGMLDLSRRAWDPELLGALPIEPDQLTEPSEHHDPSVGLEGEFAQRLPALKDVPWFPALGDGACSNVGAGAVNAGRIAIMVGNSGAMRVLCPEGRPEPPEGLWAYLLDSRRFLIGGALSNGGNWYTWLAKTLRTGARERIEAQVGQMPPDAHGLTVLPFLMGERSLGWRGDARAAILGLSAHTRPVDVIRAGLEAVAYRFALIYERLAERLPAEPGRARRIIATGGTLLHSPVWMQILADVLNEPLAASREPQASERGAAMMALEALGVLPSLEQARFRYGRTLTPDARRHARYREGLARQKWLYERLMGTGM